MEAPPGIEPGMKVLRIFAYAKCKACKKHRRTDAFFVEAPPGIEPGMKVLQTSALPLGYGAGVERETGLEPATSALARRRSTK